MEPFRAELRIIDGNPYVSVPDDVLRRLFDEAQKDRGPIPICGTVNGRRYMQTLVRFRGEWRLYVNMKMLHDSPRRIGEMITATVEYDPSDRSLVPHPKLEAALQANEAARHVFEKMPPSRRNEIVRYIASLKREDSVERNVERAINFLLGRGRFVGRDRPD